MVAPRAESANIPASPATAVRAADPRATPRGCTRAANHAITTAPAAPPSVPSRPPRRRRGRPTSRPGSATSLAEQLVQQPAFKLRWCTLGAAPGPQKPQEHPFEVEVLPTGLAIGQVVPDLPFRLRGQLLVQELVQMLFAFAAVHAGLPLM